MEDRPLAALWLIGGQRVHPLPHQVADALERGLERRLGLALVKRFFEDYKALRGSGCRWSDSCAPPRRARSSSAVSGSTQSDGQSSARPQLADPSR
jgi:hypothetical protein